MSKVHVGRLSLDLCTHAAANALCFTKSLLIPKRIDNFLYSVTFLMRLTALLRWELPESAQLFLPNTSQMRAGSSSGYVQKTPRDWGNYFPLHRPSYLTQKARLLNDARYRRTHSA